MKMLRAREQIEGICPKVAPFVRVPMLGLSRRVEVKSAGDDEYNGIYFCTGCNGNGFIFTKPRVPERRVGLGRARSRGSGAGTVRVRVWQNEYLWHQYQQQRQDRNEPNIIHEGNHDYLATRGNQDAVIEGEETLPGRLLRCIIAKRFSNEVSFLLYFFGKLHKKALGQALGIRCRV